MIIIKAAAVLLINFIMYLAFGSFITMRKGGRLPLAVTVTTGFFAYYALFAIVCIPFMLTYRPLSALAKAWLVPCLIITIVSAVLYRRAWAGAFSDCLSCLKKRKGFYAAVIAITVISVILVVATYSFTLDAAYYVASVSTNVDTNMINVYDPFTGAWQDHFELRYAFATYYAADSVVCYLTGIPALVETKTVMSATVMIIVNVLYVHICGYFFDDDRKQTLMYVFMTIMNYMFITIYTTANFLMTRTYEGKSIVGNISVIMIFVLYMELVKNEKDNGRLFVMLFAVCLGTATVSSTANMVIPAEVFVLFAPYALIRRKIQILAKAVVCILPELVMMLIYVLYVKGYFAIYTFPR